MIHQRDAVLAWFQENKDDRKLSNKSKASELPMSRFDIWTHMYSLAQRDVPYLNTLQSNPDQL